MERVSITGVQNTAAFKKVEQRATEPQRQLAAALSRISTGPLQLTKISKDVKLWLLSSLSPAAQAKIGFRKGVDPSLFEITLVKVTKAYNLTIKNIDADPFASPPVFRVEEGLLADLGKQLAAVQRDHNAVLRERLQQLISS